MKKNEKRLDKTKNMSILYTQGKRCTGHSPGKSRPERAGRVRRKK